jgi:hypothetical protein
MIKSFKKFLEEKEQGEGSPFIKSLGSLFDINPEDLNTQVASFFQAGQNGLGTNLGSYKIVGSKRNKEGKITHAVVKMISLDKTYKDKGGEFSEIPSQETEKEILVPIGDLDELLQQDFKPQGQPPM